MKTVISSKGQIVLPAELRELDQICSGQGFSIERLQAGAYLLKRLEPEAEGLVGWLRSCPHSDWLEEIPSESTDTLEALWAEGSGETPTWKWNRAELYGQRFQP